MGDRLPKIGRRSMVMETPVPIDDQPTPEILDRETDQTPAAIPYEKRPISRPHELSGDEPVQHEIDKQHIEGQIAQRHPENAVALIRYIHDPEHPQVRQPKKSMASQPVPYRLAKYKMIEEGPHPPIYPIMPAPDSPGPVFQQTTKIRRPTVHLSSRIRTLTTRNQRAGNCKSIKYKSGTLFAARPYILKNYFKVAWRNLLRSKVYSSINLIGLSTGMAIALLIGLWILDELSFDTYHQNRATVAQVMDNQTLNGNRLTLDNISAAVPDELRAKFSADFKRVTMVSQSTNILAVGNKKLSAGGSWAQPDFPEMLTLKMAEGSRAALNDPTSILLSSSLATALFGSKNNCFLIFACYNHVNGLIFAIDRFDRFLINDAMRKMYIKSPRPVVKGRRHNSPILN